LGFARPRVPNPEFKYRTTSKGERADRSLETLAAAGNLVDAPAAVVELDREITALLAWVSGVDLADCHG
jgi:hypothetical protein